MTQAVRKKLLFSKAASSLVLGIALVPALLCAQGPQRNIVFKNVPYFLWNTWTIVLGPDQRGGVADGRGSVMTGNALVMLSHKDSAKTVGDFDEQIEVDSVIQYNLPSKNEDTGFITFFEFRGKTGSAILYPGMSFSTLSVRMKSSGPFVSYVIAQPLEIAELKNQGSYAADLERQRKLLAKQYSNLSLGLDH